MANPQKENGHTDIANEVLEQLYSIPLSGSEFRVILFIFRKTWGWKKKEDSISLSQIVTKTKLSRKQACEVVNKLVAKRLLFKNKKYINSYSFNKDYDQWVVTERTLGGYCRPKELPKGKQIVTETKPKVVTETKHTKEKKETYTKERTPSQIAEEFFRSDRQINLFAEKLSEKKKLHFDFCKNEILKFRNYWTELSRTGKKQRWEMEKTFEVDRRLQTWFSNVRHYNYNVINYQSEPIKYIGISEEQRLKNLEKLKEMRENLFFIKKE